MTPIPNPFDFNHDDILDPQEQFMEYMIFRDVMGEDEDEEGNELDWEEE